MSVLSLHSLIASHDPIKFFKMDEPALAASLIDDGSDGVSLTNTNSPVTGAPGPIAGMRSVDYSGAANMVSLNAAATLTMANARSFIVIARTPFAGTPAATEYIGCGRHDGDNNNLWALAYLTNGKLRFTHTVGGNIDSWETSASAYDGLWHMYSYTFNNGVTDCIGLEDNVSTGVHGSLNLAADNGFALGARRLSVSPFASNIALFAAIDGVLTPDEKTAIYNAYVDEFAPIRGRNLWTQRNRWNSRI